ncbi:MAG: hypothetical protein H7328_08220 [Bdellovibrio sp.]|nr:hypothetical protein [Bdellovibrio sp.]
MLKASLILLIAPVAMATLTPSLPRGEQIIARSAGEICVIPSKLSGGEYSKKDLQLEQTLCSYDINGSAATVAACGKTASTNPAVEFYSIPEGMTAAQVEAKSCDVPESKMLTKYKLSTSCSYTPSILGYYHLSRLLGDVNQVPVSVLRTMDVQRHTAIGKKTIAELAAKKQGASLIAQTWGSLLSFLSPGSTSPKRDLMMTDDFKQSYGALQKNPNKEEKYTDMFFGGADQAARAVNFRDKSPIYQILKSSKPANILVSNRFEVANVQKVLQMKNVADMILLDTLMNQSDRFGNIHYTEEFYYVEAGEVKHAGKMTPEEITAKGAIKARAMMMKDNDCGVNRPNHLKTAGLLAGLAHFNPETYHKLLKLNADLASDSMKSFMKKETMMTDADYASLKANAAFAAATLQNACRSGKLQLDLDLDGHFAGVAMNTSCE